jgi:membrane protein implicated in regulation of membrane protease activity
LAALAAFVFPASVAVLGLERNILVAIYPIALARMIRGLGLVYFLVLLVIAAYAFGIGMLMRWVSFLPLELALAMFGILSVFSVLGGALYERRNELGLETRRSPERTAELERLAEERESHAQVTDAYGQMRAGSHTKAWALLQDWLASRGHTIADYHWLFEHVAHWHDRRYANRLTEDYLEKLVVLKEYGRALDVVRQRLDQDPSFRPKSAATTLRLAELAAQGGGLPRIARALVADFDTRFPGDPSVVAARALAERLGR